MEQGAEMDAVKAVAVTSSVLLGIRTMLDIFRKVRIAMKPKPEGVTLFNGEYRALLHSIQGVQERQDAHKKAMDVGMTHLGSRIDGLERRLST